MGKQVWGALAAAGRGGWGRRGPEGSVPTRDRGARSILRFPYKAGRGGVRAPRCSESLTDFNS